MLEWPDAEDVHTIVGGINCGSQGLLDISVKCRLCGPEHEVSKGALDREPPMLHVDFKKWQFRMSLSLIFPNVTCRICKKKAMSHVTIFCIPFLMSLSPT